MAVTKKNVISIKAYLRTMADLIHLVQRIRSMHLERQISKGDFDRILLVISELATNIIRHAGSGSVKVSFAHRGSAYYVFITAMDRGPGIPNIEEALKVGFSSKGSLGLGLPAILAQLDNLKLKNRTPTGFTIAGLVRTGTNSKTLNRRRKSFVSHMQITNAETWPVVKGLNLDISHFAATHPNATVSGDLVFRFTTPAGLVFGIFDGLGHGPAAYAAAKRFEAAAASLVATIENPLNFLNFIKTVDGQMTTGRSGVLGIALATNGSDVYFSRTGNISALLVGGTSWAPSVNNGILGDGSICKNVEKISIKPGDTLVTYSDGLKAIHEKDILLEGRYSSADLVARRLHEKKTRNYDDSSLIVARYHLCT